MKINESARREIRKLDYDELLDLFDHIIQGEYPDEYKKAVIPYMHRRLKFLIKKKDYNNPNITDKECIQKWGA